MSFDLKTFDKQINLNFKKKLKIESKYPQEKFIEVTSYFSSGVTYEKSDVSNTVTNNAVLTADNINLNGHLDIKKIIYLKSTLKLSEDKKLKANDIFICLSSGSKKHIGKVTFIDKDSSYYAGGFMGIIRSNNKINSKYLYTLLRHPNIKKMMEINSTGNNINNLYNQLNNIKLPLPPMNIQEEIVKEILALENLSKNNTDKVNILQNNIAKVLKTDAKEEKLNKYLLMPVKRGKSPKYSYKSDIQILKSGQIRGLKEFDFSKKYYADKSMTIDERLLQRGDLLINSTGVGTAGRVNLFNLNGKFFVDSHVAICRLNKELLLPLYALYQLYYFVGFKNIEKMATGQSGQIELAPDTIGNIKIPVPSIQEQKRIVTEIMPIEEEIEKLQKEIDEIPAKKQAILDKYLK